MNSRRANLVGKRPEYNTLSYNGENSFRGRKENINIQPSSKPSADKSITNEKPSKRIISLANNGIPSHKRKISFASKSKLTQESEPLQEALSDLKLDSSLRFTQKLDLCEPMTDIDRQSQNAIQEYGNEIEEYEKVLEKQYSIEDCLKNHEITPNLRAKMVDWMVEVLTNFKCNDQTFFMSVALMDRYFKQKSPRKLISELHIIGVASMFLGSKYEDILPLRMEMVYEKIAHKKLSIEAIKSYEQDILETLDYFLQVPTPLEFLRRYLKGMEPVLKEEKQLIEKMALYLTKMCMHDYFFCGVSHSNIAVSSIYVALKICEQLKKHAILNKEIVEQMIEVSGYKEEQIVEIAQKILNDAQNFDTLFPGLTNLKKTHFTGLMEYVPK